MRERGGFCIAPEVGGESKQHFRRPPLCMWKSDSQPDLPGSYLIQEPLASYKILLLMAVGSQKATKIMLCLSLVLPQPGPEVLKLSGVDIWTERFFVVGRGPSCALLDVRQHS